MATPVKKGARRGAGVKKVMPNQGIGTASRRSNPSGQRKLRSAPARSNAGGAVRGKARAAAVKKAPISIVRGGKKTSITGSRSVSARSIRRGLGSKPKAASAGAPSASPSAKKPELQDYAGNPVEFLKDFLSGGVLRKR